MLRAQESIELIEQLDSNAPDYQTKVLQIMEQQQFQAKDLSQNDMQRLKQLKEKALKSEV